MACRYGVYEWSYASGSFLVALRPNGTFYCEKYAAQAYWQVVDNKIYLDWKNYGQYEFVITNPNLIEGSVRGDASKWRKMTFVREFNSLELALLGNGHGTAWDFVYEKGSFGVEFRCDGFNHFVCPQFPAHSHWSIQNNDTLLINFGQYGEFELKLDQATNTLVGHKKGQPANWRRCTFVRAMTELESTANMPDHDHSHVHTATCGH